MKTWTLVLSLCTAFAYANALECSSCFGDDWADCDSDSKTVTCPSNAGHCYLGYALHTDGKTLPKMGVARGCTNCDDKEIGCRMINESLKAADGRFIKVCDITSCCKSDNCNAAEQPKLPSLTCKSCFGKTWADCNETDEKCAAGFTHCYAGYAQITDGNSTPGPGVSKGCTYCPTPSTGCRVLNEIMKARSDLDGVFMKSCDMKCCSSDGCNTGYPTAPPVTAPPATETTAAATTPAATTSTGTPVKRNGVMTIAMVSAFLFFSLQ